MNNCVWYFLGECEINDNRCQICEHNINRNTAKGKMIFENYKSDLKREVEVDNDNSEV